MFRLVQTAKHLCQGRFSASITTRQKHYLARFEAKIDWPQDKCSSSIVSDVRKLNIHQLQAFPLLRWQLCDWFRLGGFQCQAHLLYHLHCDIRFAKRWRLVHEVTYGLQYIHNDQYKCGEICRTHVAYVRGQEHKKSNRKKCHRLSPCISQHIRLHRCHGMLLKARRTGFETLRHKTLPTIAV